MSISWSKRGRRPITELLLGPKEAGSQSQPDTMCVVKVLKTGGQPIREQ